MESVRKQDNFSGAPPQKGASSFIFPPTKANIAFFSNTLLKGGLVAIPTETVYGLAAVATNPRACQTIFQIKGRPLLDPLIVHVKGVEMAQRVACWNEDADKLASAFWPGPLSLILNKKSCVPSIVTAGKETVAIRAPRHRVAQELIQAVGSPLAAPSANPFGYISPSLAQHVAESFGKKVPFILDGGPCEIGLESTIIDVSDPTHVRILRPGAVTKEMVEKQLHKRVDSSRTTQTETDSIMAPGTLPSHYCPDTPLELFSGSPAYQLNSNSVRVFLKAPPLEERTEKTFWFSHSGDPSEIAHSLFALLRNLDKMKFDRIYCETPSTSAEGLWIAIGDRLQRAAAKSH